MKSCLLTHPKAYNRIVLDYPLDIILDRECLLQDYENGAVASFKAYQTSVKEKLVHLLKSNSQLNESNIKEGLEQSEFYKELMKIKGKIGSIRIPCDQEDCLSPRDPGSGNILIKGRPGTGKSTLALQMAVACTYSPNRYSAIYLSLEEPVEHVRNKAKKFGWEDNVRDVQFLDNIDDTSSDEQIGETLKRILTQPPKCKFRDSSGVECQSHSEILKPNEIQWFEPTVIMPLLSPRPLSKEPDASDALFWERYRQLEKLLIGAQWLRKNSPENLEIPEVRIVCIDSLSVFGNQPLTRPELFRIFDLVKRYGLIGIFTLEQDGDREQPATGDVADYLTDILIQLYLDEDNSYTTRYIEVKKSKYQHEVYGKHFVRMRGREVWLRDRKQWSNESIQKVSEKIVELCNNNLLESEVQPKLISEIKTELLNLSIQ
jgi:KaiC/GvpD/RAD55 family RecA-like ATPase